ncbi:MAG: DEAD/DEAH box helicase [Victivallaceae bacterium]|nr:DEAD/DEAH box helicase [Victivallaceae bacterium]
MFDLFVSPQGNLHDDEGTFVDGNGKGLLSLVKSELTEELPGKQCFRKMFMRRIDALASRDLPADGGISPVLDDTRPSVAECSAMLLSMPPVLGMEYLDAETIHRYFCEFDGVLADEIASYGGRIVDFLRSLSPAWRNVGKVTFHLAENRSDSTGMYPFAFMVSFVWDPPGRTPRNLPLASALKAFADDRFALNSILEPIAMASKESALLRRLLESRRIFQPSAWTSDTACEFLREIPVYERANIVVRMTNLWKARPPKVKVSVALDVKDGVSLGAGALLDFSVNATLDGEPLTREEMETLLASSGGLVRLKGQWVEADSKKISELLKSWNEAKAMASSDGMSFVDGLRLLAGMGASRSSGAGITSDGNLEINAGARFREIMERLSDPARNETPPLPGNRRDTLRPYQVDGVKFLLFASRIGFGTCLADDMGLGKTLQVLALIELWKRSGVLDKLPVLLVLPATLLANWQGEREKFTPDLTMAVLHPSAMSPQDWKSFEKTPEKYLAKYDVALTTYGMLSRLPQLAQLEFPAVIADEAQAIKNPDSAQSRAVRALKSPRRIALTGTPIENRLADLWCIFDFINRGLLRDLRGFIGYTKSLAGDYSSLRKLTSPFILRRMKTDKRIIRDLPDKVENKVYCSLSRWQAALYTGCVEELAEALASEQTGIRRKGLVLAYLSRFKQICNHPDQFSGTGDFLAEDSGKFLRVADLVESIAARQEKVLVFTQFREMTGPLSEHLEKCFGRPGLVLHGGTPVKERQGLVREFQAEGGPPFFVISLRAGGTGLNLTAANHVIHFDRWWNPAVERQASDRAYRIGQKRNVLIHKFICRGTLEERIDQLMTDKQKLSDDIIGGGAEKMLTEMSDKEILDIVKLNPMQLEG